MLEFSESAIWLDANGNWEKNTIIFNFGLRDNNLKLIMQTPFEWTKKVSILGKYSNNLNGLNINASGLWNDYNINYYGTLTYETNVSLSSKLDIGKSYQGALYFDFNKMIDTTKLNMACFYRSDKNQVEVIISSETINNVAKIKFLAITPFKIVKEILADIISEPNALKFNATVDVLNETNHVIFEGHFDNPLLFDANFLVDLGHVKLNSTVDQPKQYKFIINQKFDFGKSEINSTLLFQNQKPFVVKLFIGQSRDKIYFAFNDSIEFDLDCTKICMKGFALVDLFDKRNIVNYTICPNGISEFSVINSFLPYPVLIFQLNNTSVHFFAGDDIPNFWKELGHSYILFKSWLHSKEFVLKLDAPNISQFSLLDISGKLDLDNDTLLFTKNIQLKSNVIGNLNLTSNLNITYSGAEINMAYLLPFVATLPEFSINLYMPFAISDNFMAKVFVFEFKNNYSLHCTVKYVPNNFFISSGYQYASNEADLLIYISKNDFTPLPDVTFFNYISNIFPNIVKFTFNSKSIVQNVINNKHNKLSPNVLGQNKTSFFLGTILSHPFYRENIRLSLGINFENFQKFQMDGIILLPTILSSKFAISHDFTLGDELNRFALKSFAEINNFSFGLKVKSAFGYRHLYLIADVQAAQNRVFTHLNYHGSIFDHINFVYELKTPIAMLSNLNVSFVSSQNLLNGVNIAISHNDRPLASLYLHTVPNNFSIHFYNVFIPLSGECRYLKSDVFELAGKICWDFNSSDSSQLGGHIHLGKNISIGFITPNRVIRLDANIYKNSERTHYFGKVSWFKNQAIYASCSFTNRTSKSKTFETSHWVLSFPFRTFEIVSELETKTKFPPEIYSNITFKWASNKSSSIYLYNAILPEKLISKVFIPIWKHEIILNIDLCLSKIPSYVKARLTYSNDINKDIHFEVFYNENAGRTERLIILQHPYSKVNYTLQSISNRLHYASYGNLSLVYSNYLLNRQEEIKGFWRISHEKFEVHGEVETSKNYISLLGTYITNKHGQGFVTVLKINDKEPFTVSFKKADASLSLATSYGKDRIYNFYSGFPSKREFTTKICSTMYDQELIQGFLSVKLNTSQLLWVKVLWKTNLFRDYFNMISNEYSDLRFIVESTVRELIDVIEDDVDQRLFLDLYNIRQNTSTYINNELKLLSNDYLNFLNDIEDGYKSNSFYYKYIQEFIGTVFPQAMMLKEVLIDPFWDFFHEVFNQLTLAIQEVHLALNDIYQLIQKQIQYSLNQILRIKQLKDDAKAILKNGIEEARKSLHQTEIALLNFVEDIDQNIADIKQQCIDYSKPYLNVIEKFIEYVEQRLTLIQMLILDMLDTLQDYIVNLRESKEIIKMYAIYINWLEEFHITEMLEPIADVLEQTLATIYDDFIKVTEKYTPYAGALLEAIFGDYQKINTLPSLIEFRTNISSFSQKIIWIWNHHNLTSLIKNEIHQYVSNFDDYLMAMIKFNCNNSDFENMFEISNYVFRPDMGIIEVTQALPFELKSFDSIPEFRHHPLYDEIMEKVENLVKIQKHRLSDIINSIKTYIGESSENLLSPPTNNIAMITSDYNFITFDGKYFAYEGNCSYILTSEFVTKSFTVQVNYELFHQKAITITTPLTTVKIYLNSTVLQDNKETSLPLINGSMVVSQDFHQITVDYAKELKVVCNFYYNYCTIQLSGWLFGKVGGLLGTLDNDISTDFNLPNGSEARDLESLAQGWQVGKCYDTVVKNITSISPLSETLFQTLCQLLFININSPLASCFNVVDSSPFYSICVSDMKNINNPTMCSSIAAYRTRCKHSRILINMPQMCIHCKYNISAGEEIFDGKTPKAIDVVIIKESNCYNSFSSLIYFAKELNRYLNSSGYTNNKFSVIGYGSDKPYTYLSKNKVWTSVEDLSPNIKTLSKGYLNADNSIIQTLEYVISNLEFRPGVTKQFILISCNSNNKHEDISSLSLSFVEKDVTMHSLKLNAVKKSHKNVLFVPKELNNFTIPDLNAIISYKQKVVDISSLLALSTGGVAYHVNSKGKVINIDMITAFARVVASTATHTPCQRCRCVPNPDGTGKVDCMRCMSPIVKQLLNEYEANGIVFPTR